MSLFDVLDAIADRLADSLGVPVSDRIPVDDAELPAVTITADRVGERLVGIGRVPRGTRAGALAVAVEIDLADPVLDALPLLSPDRRTVTLPNGPLVRADGIGEPPFDAVDLQVDDGAPFTVVGTVPTGRQVRPNPVDATLAFGVALAPTGTLTVNHFVGQWDVTVSRYQGELAVAVAAATATGVRTLSRRVADALGRPDPVARLAPRGCGAVTTQQLGGTDVAGQTLGYRFDAEFEEPDLASGGGVISTVAVDLRTDTALDSFTIARQGGPA